MTELRPPIQIAAWQGRPLEATRITVRIVTKNSIQPLVLVAHAHARCELLYVLKFFETILVYSALYGINRLMVACLLEVFFHSVESLQIVGVIISLGKPRLLYRLSQEKHGIESRPQNSSS